MALENSSCRVLHRVCCLFLSVKVHQVRGAPTALLNLNDTTNGNNTQNKTESGNELLNNVAGVILLHNGLMDKETIGLLKQSNLPIEKMFTMVTSAGSTLFTAEELTALGPERELAAVARPTGPGPSYLSRLLLQESEMDSDPMKDETTDKDPTMRAMRWFADSVPGCHLVSFAKGRKELVFKLAVNVSLNGLLAWRALEEWYAGTGPAKWVINHEIMPLMPLAQDIGRLVSYRARLHGDDDDDCNEDDTVADMLAERVVSTMASVPSNVCSTVVDINAKRVTEGRALFHTVTNETPPPPPPVKKRLRRPMR